MEHLAGLIESTRHLATPFLVVDPGILASNISRMQAACEGVGVGLRPHIKTHKSSVVARMQLDAGAAGVTCATVSEAIALGEAGCRTDVYISTPVFLDRPKARLVERAAGLHDRLTMTVDSVPVVRSVLDWSSVAVMVEVDSGLGRTGARPEAAAELARMAGDRFVGFATHGGHGYAPGAAAAAGADERRALAESIRLFGGRVGVVSAGSTPTAPHALGEPVNELRPGTYVFGDHQQVLLGACGRSDVAAAVIATVIHVSAGRFVIDAGAKALTKDRAPWIESYGRVVGRSEAVVDRLNDNHGMVNSEDLPAVGDRVAVVPNHICPVVNLFDQIWLVEPDAAVSVHVDLRGHLT